MSHGQGWSQTRYVARGDPCVSTPKCWDWQLCPLHLAYGSRGAGDETLVIVHARPHWATLKARQVVSEWVRILRTEGSMKFTNWSCFQQATWRAADWEAQEVLFCIKIAKGLLSKKEASGFKHSLKCWSKCSHGPELGIGIMVCVCLAKCQTLSSTLTGH